MALIRLTKGIRCSGEVEQLMPGTSTPKALNVRATISGLEPVRVLPEVSKVIVAIRGSVEFSFTASMAALIS